MSFLISKEEYLKQFERPEWFNTQECSGPHNKCPKCGEGVYKNEMMVLSCYPPKFTYKCLNNNCDYIDYLSN